VDQRLVKDVSSLERGSSKNFKKGGKHKSNKSRYTQQDTTTPHQQQPKQEEQEIQQEDPEEKQTAYDKLLESVSRDPNLEGEFQSLFKKENWKKKG